MPRLPLLSKYWVGLRPGAFAFGERVGHAHAIDRVLLEAVHHFGRLDVEDVIDRRHNVIDVVELRARRFVRLDARRPGDRQGIARAAEVRGDQLGVLERRVASPGPAGVVHVVHLGPAERVETADLVQRSNLLLDGVRDLILSQQFADAAELAFSARSVVAPDVEDDGVVADAEALKLIDHLARLDIDVFHKAGEYFHQPPLERTLRFRDAVPRGHALGPGGQLGISRYPSQGLLLFEDTFAHDIPAVVELALVLVSPLLEDVVRAVCCAGRPVHEERLVGRERAMLAHPGNRLVCHVLAQMVLLVVRRLDRVEVLVQPRLPLRGLAGEEAVEIVKTNALARGPEGERPHRRGLGCRSVVPLAESSALVAVVSQDLGQGRGRPGNHAGVAVPVHRAFRDGPGTHALVVAPGQQRRARRRADGGGVKGVVADARVGKFRQGRRADWSAEGIRQAEADIVEQDDEYVGCVLRQPVGLSSPLHPGFLQGLSGDAGRGDLRKGQGAAVIGSGSRNGSCD